MTRISRIGFIALTFAIAGSAMLGQGASASTANTSCSGLSQTQTMKCCAGLSNQDSAGCREFVRIKKRLLVKAIHDDDGGGDGGKGGRGGRGGRK